MGNVTVEGVLESLGIVAAIVVMMWVFSVFADIYGWLLENPLITLAGFAVFSIFCFSKYNKRRIR